ncbi:MAG: hypothetical protein LBH39_02690 [Clostridiales Family XIII bacterium]|nr:hypothetical protein [Clostridiales Family XIII bacterium]
MEKHEKRLDIGAGSPAGAGAEAGGLAGAGPGPAGAGAKAGGLAGAGSIGAGAKAGGIAGAGPIGAGAKAGGLAGAGSIGAGAEAGGLAGAGSIGASAETGGLAGAKAPRATRRKATALCAAAVLVAALFIALPGYGPAGAGGGQAGEMAGARTGAATVGVAAGGPAGGPADAAAGVAAPAGAAMGAPGGGLDGAAAPSEKEEVVYAILGHDGAVRSIAAVNILTPEGGRILDYGEFASVRNMTTNDVLNVSGGMIAAKTDASKLYYEGQMQGVELPWDINIEYSLDGKKMPAEKVAGKSGKLKIDISVGRNEKSAGPFFESHAVQLTLTLDTANCTGIIAEGATEANVGAKKQFTYTIMPGKGRQASVYADVTDFEMAALTINAGRLSFDIDIDDSELRDKVNELAGGTAAVADGAQELEEGLVELRRSLGGSFTDGVGRLANGSAELRDGLDTLGDGARRLDDGVASLKSGTESMDGAVSEMHSGIIQMSLALDELYDSSPKLTEGSTSIREAISKIRSALAQADPSTERLKELLDASAAIGAGIGDISNALRLLSAQVSFSAYKAAMQERGLDVEMLRAADAELAAAIESQAQSLLEQVDRIEELIVGLLNGEFSLTVWEDVLREAERLIQDLLGGSGGLIDMIVGGPAGRAALPPELRGMLDESGSGIDSLLKEIDGILDAIPAPMPAAPAIGGASATGAARPAATAPAGDPAGDEGDGGDAPGAAAAPTPSEDPGTAGTSGDSGASGTPGTSGDSGATAAEEGAGPGQGLPPLPSVDEFGALMDLLRTQLGQLSAVGTFLRANKGAIDGMEAYLDAANTGIRQLSNGVDGLEAQYQEFDGAIGELVYTMSDMLAKISELKNGVDFLARRYREFDTGVGDYTFAVARIVAEFKKIVGGAEQMLEGSKILRDGVAELGAGVSDMASGVEELYGGAEELADGAGELKEGTSEMLDGVDRLGSGSEDLAQGAAELRDRTRMAEGQITAKIDELIESLAGAGGAVESFVSEKNVNIRSVQFVMRTDALEAPAAPETEEPPPQKRGFWDKLLRLFGIELSGT